MSNQNSNMDNLLNSVSKHLGKKPEELTSAAQSGNLNNLLGNLSPKDSEKIQKVLSDKDAANKLLSSPQAQKLIKKLLGDQ